MATDISGSDVPDDEEETEDLGLGEYPSPRKIPDDNLDRELSGSVPEHRDGPSEVEVIRRLRELGVAVVRANYRGGHDEAYYDLIELFDEDGRAITDAEKVAAFLDGLDWHNGPEVIAVDRAHGGYFSGAGDGRAYGGTVEMRLDTLETREIGTYAEVARREDHSGADWGSGRTTVY